MEQARIVEAVAKPNYRLWLRFADGSSGEVDLSHLVGRGVFARWLKPGEFEKVQVEADFQTVVWPVSAPGDVELDLCSDVLCSKATGRPLPGEAEAA